MRRRPPQLTPLMPISRASRITRSRLVLVGEHDSHRLRHRAALPLYIVAAAFVVMHHRPCYRVAILVAAAVVLQRLLLLVDFEIAPETIRGHRFLPYIGTVGTLWG